MANGKQAPKISVIGIGNMLMGDDGIGIAVAEALLPVLSSHGVNVVTGGTAGMGLIRHFLESDVVIVIDAIDAGNGVAPGTMFKFDPDEAGITNLRSTNTHGMGVSYLITNTRLMGVSPKVVVFGIQVGDVRENDCILTEPVAASMNRVCELVLEELEVFGITL
ncbi:MAG TPA: hydrogenase maturation protease [Candidatus Aquicultor sp.]|jgi:hydrogenase maturation protease